MFNKPASAAQRRAVKLVNALMGGLGYTSFEWTSNQFNQNTNSTPHTDKNNLGPSFALVLGDFEGGSLCVPGRDIVTPDGGSPHGLFIDGRELHYTKPIEGLRYLVVALVHSAAMI